MPLAYTDLQAVIFDLDETLLDNRRADGMNLHEHSRIQAARLVGERHGLPTLRDLTPAQAKQAFFDAQVHSLHGILWQTLGMLGLIDAGNVDLEHPLVLEMAALKDELHEELLRTEGKPTPGALEFVSFLDSHGLHGKLAIATTAGRRDAELFIELFDLADVFPPEHIISREQCTQLKPHPEVYERAFQSLGLPGKINVLAFEDDPRGVSAAKGAGLQVYALTTFSSRETLASAPVPPDAIAPDFWAYAKLLQMPLQHL